MNAQVTYLDNNATTQLDPRVLEAMLPYLTEQYGNPSSLHHFGAQVGARIEEARATVAAAIGARESEIVFTSGGTESNNLALRSVLAARPNRRRLVISAVEHHAILEPADALAREGVEVIKVGVDAAGRLDLAELERAIDDQTALVSIMLANNETGVIVPLARVAEIAKRRGTIVHTDAVNALGKMPVNVGQLGVDLLTISAHKIHGPKGSGALYVRRGTPFSPQILGGPQERQRRGGTSNVAGIVGFARACELLDLEDMKTVGALRDELERAIVERLPQAQIIGGECERIPNTLCICVAGVGSEAVLLLLSEAGVCASSGAACSSGSLEPSHVLQAMGIDPQLAQGQVRFSLSRYTSRAEIATVLEILPRAVERVSAVNI